MPIYSKQQKKDKAYNIAFGMVCEHGNQAPAILRDAVKQAKAILKFTADKYKKKEQSKGCKRHPKYQGKRKPVNNCRQCLEFYNSLKWDVVTSSQRRDGT